MTPNSTTATLTHVEVDAAALVAATVIRHPSLVRPVLAGVQVALDALRPGLDDDEYEHVQDEP